MKAYSKQYVTQWILEELLTRAVEIAEKPDDYLKNSRTWIARSDAYESPEDLPIIVMSYNLMHDLIFSKKNYWPFEYKYLDYDHRVKKVMDQVKQYMPSIINFQESRRKCPNLIKN